MRVKFQDNDEKLDLGVLPPDNNDVMLASCSQDNFIRVWRITKAADLADKTGVDEVDERLRTLELTSNKFSVMSEGEIF